MRQTGKSVPPFLTAAATPGTAARTSAPAAARVPGLHLVIYGWLLIVMMIFYPGGVAELARWFQLRLRRMGS